MKKALLVTLALLVTSRAWAQDASDVPVVHEHDVQLDANQQRDLRQWTDDVRAYQRWYEQNRNRVAYNIFGFAAGRREIPAVPEWLPDKCDLLGYLEARPVGELSAGCDLLAYYRSHAYGLVGVHVTLPELAKRVQIYLPPGFLLLSIPDGVGGREFKPAATIGVSIKMFRFVFPQGKDGTAYFNLAKAYVINHASSMDMRADVDLIGLSFSWGR